MKFQELCRLVREDPLFSSSFLMAGNINAPDLTRQLSRWIRDGKIIQLRRGLYLLSRDYRRSDPLPFYVANRLQSASYVSLQSALAHYGMIPEAVPLITSVTTKRPESLATPIGTYQFRHLHLRLFFGYRSHDLGAGQAAFIADPEKALLDLVHLTPGSDNQLFIKGLRLQNVEQISADKLKGYAARSGQKKWQRAADLMIDMMSEGEM